MDPPTLVSNGPIPEMWPFPLGVHHPAAAHAGMADQLGGHNSGFLVEMGAAESTVTEQSAGIRNRRRRRDSVAPAGAGAGAAASEDECSKLVSSCSGNDLTDYEIKHPEVMESRDDSGDSKAEVEASSGMCNSPANRNAQPSEAPKQDYIHVRARRGQATDSHSLAERARREKISERMKILQDLVPGCNKIIGKALVLDEIINYIQSLQRQVEFLSMKLEAVNSGVGSGDEGFPAKDFGIQTFGTAPGLAFGSQTTREFAHGSPPEWLHMQVGGGFERPT